MDNPGYEEEDTQKSNWASTFINIIYYRLLVKYTLEYVLQPNILLYIYALLYM